jgi:hypothetical protein
MTMPDDVLEARLLEIGRITTTWAKFEHWIDQAIWILADVERRKGACITTQMGSIHGKFRALEALMREAERPETAFKAIHKLAADANTVGPLRNTFAHGPLDMGVNFDTRDFEVYLRNIGVRGKELTFETTVLTAEQLNKVQEAVTNLYMKLIENWPLIVGKSSSDALAPPRHK